MKKCIIRIKDEVTCVITGLDPQDNKFLYEKFGIYVDGYRWMPAFKLGGWDGKKRFFQITGSTFVKLLDKILPYIAAWNYEFELHDDREYIPPIIDRVKSDRFSQFIGYKNKPVEIRGYQCDAANLMLEAGSGVYIGGTGFGKCVYGKTIINISVSEELGDIINEIKKRKERHKKKCLEFLND